MVMENQFASESKMQQEIDKAKKKIKLKIRNSYSVPYKVTL